jgi:type II secretory pathway pseudopilin PulG
MNLKSRQGASLVELCIATALFSIILSMVSIAMSRVMSAPVHAHKRFQAQSLALDQLEALKTESYAYVVPTFASDAQTCDCSGPSIQTTIEPLQRNGQHYERQTCITYVATTSEGKLKSSCTPTGQKLVVVKVFDPERPGQLQVESEMLLNDPLGAPVPREGTAQVRGQVETPLQNPLRSLPIVLLISADRHWVQSTLSDAEGHFQFSRLSPGSYEILPQIRPREAIEPVHWLWTAGTSDIETELDTPFILKRGTGLVRIHSNRAGTLVVASSEILPFRLPDIQVGSSAPPYFSAILDENEYPWSLPEDSYSLKCVAPSGENTVPSGGVNRILTAQDPVRLACLFP